MIVEKYHLQPLFPVFTLSAEIRLSGSPQVKRSSGDAKDHTAKRTLQGRCGDISP